MIFIIIIISCSKKEKEKPSDLNNTEELELLKIEYKGCFDDPFKDIQENNDTLFYTVNGDSLILNIQMNYNCCGLLKDSIELGINEVNIFISDTCTLGLGCECDCICNFDFEYYFRNFRDIHFYVYLKSLYQNEYSLWNDLEYNN